MLKCPFCGYDYSEHGLRDGRCTNCGSVLAWEGGSGDAPDSVRAAVLAQTINSLRPAARSGTGAPVVAPSNNVLPPAASPPSEPRPALPDATASSEPTPGRDSDAVPQRLVDRPPEIPSEILRTIAPAQLSPDDVRDVSAAWKVAAESEGVRPESTLKGRGSGKVTDTQLVIQTRSMVNRQDNNASIPVNAEYELLNVIGQGGVGVVYLARQSSIDRDVAVKMLRTDRVEDPGSRDKFLAEAVVTGDLDHPNIVPIYDLGTNPSGALFYSMKRVQGTPWHEVLRQRSLAQNLEILLKVSDAIAFAHARGIVHRDIKPENVMLGEFGEVLVMDWGIALPMESYAKSSGFLRTQGLGGSPAYMAPEMVTGPPSRIGPPSDVYLLGAALYEILTGRPPHAGRNVMECLMAAARNDIVATEVSGELLEIALRALATRPEDRYPTVPAFQAAIREYESHAESIALSTRAVAELEQARRTGAYDDYSRAVFAHQEALALWSGNKAARAGVNEAKLAYAANAFEKGDFDLGLSLLDPDNPAHAELREQLAVAVAERNARQSRLRYVKRLVAALVVLMFLGGAAAYWKISQEKEAAEKAKEVAEKAEQRALDSAKEEEEAKQRALDSAKEEEEAKRKAIASATEALEQKKAAEDARQRVEEASYLDEIKVAAAKIKSNTFDVAREILEKQQASKSPKAKYRHWEWGRLAFLCQEEKELALRRATVREFRGSFPIEAFALAPDDQIVALGGRSGKIELRTRDNQLLATSEHGGGVSSLAFSADGRYLASGGASEGTVKGGTIKVWEVANRKELRQIGGNLSVPGARRVPGIVFAPLGPQEPPTLLTVADKVVYRWDWDGTANSPTWKRQKIEYHGHLDTVWSVAAFFARDGGRWILTGSEDATVRLWDFDSGRELARFTGHEGPVYAVAFAPSGTWFASAGHDKRVLLWKRPTETANVRDSVAQEVKDALTGKKPSPQFFPLEGHSASIRSIVFSGTNNVLVSAGQDNTAIVWDTTEALRKAAESGWELPLGEGPAQAGRATGPIAPPDANETISTATKSVSEPLQKVLRGHGSWIQGCAVTRDGSTVLTNSNDGTWRRWDVAAYKEVEVLHDDELHAINAARFLPGGKRVVTAHDDGTARLWDVESGREVGRFAEGHEFLMTTAKFFSDNTRLLTAAGDDTARIWDLAKKVELQCLHGTGRRAIAAISSNGTRVLTGGALGTARWWDADSGELLRTLTPPLSGASQSGNDEENSTPVVTAVAIDSTGRQLLTGDDKGHCWLWNADDGRPPELLGKHAKSVSAVYFLPDLPWTRQRNLLAVTAADDGQVRVWKQDRQPLNERGLVISAPIDASCLSADGRQLVCAASLGDKNARLWWWDVENGAELASRQELVGLSVNTLEFARSGEGEDRRVLMTTTNLQSSASLTSSTQDVKSWTLAAAKANKPPVSYFFVKGRQRIPGGTMWHATESSDGKQILTSGGKSARLWNKEGGKLDLVVNLRSHSSIVALDVSPDGRWLVTGGKEGAVKLWEIATQKPVRQLDGAHPLGKPVTCVEFSPDGRWVLTAGHEAVYLWDCEQGTLASVGEGEDRALSRVADATFDVARFAPDGHHVLLASKGTPPTLWKLNQAGDGRWRAEKQYQLDAGPSSVTSAAFSLDGRWIITGGDDYEARLWSYADGLEIAKLSGHSAPIVSVAFSADGFRALTGSKDKRAMLWDTRTLSRLYEQKRRGSNGASPGGTSIRAPQEIFTLSRYLVDDAKSTDETHDQSVTTVVFSPTGAYVLTASEDGSAFLWEGLQFAPTISLSLGKKTLAADGGAERIDDEAQVARPAADLLEPVTLKVTVAPPTGSSDQDPPNERSSLILLVDPVELWKVREGSIVYQSPFESSERVIGTVTGGESGQPLDIELQRGTPGHVLEAIVRSVALASPTAPRTVTVLFELRSGESAAQTESRDVEIGTPEGKDVESPRKGQRTTDDTDGTDLVSCSS